MEVLRTLGDRTAIAAVEKYGIRQESSTDTDRVETYYGPNIRSFMAKNQLDPSAWRQMLEYNRFGSVLDLIQGQTQLAIPSFLARS